MAQYAHARAAARSRRRDASADLAALVRRVDLLLVAATAALVGYGLWAIAGITRHDVPGNPNYYLVRQAIFAAVGGGLLLAAFFVDPQWYRRFKKPLYGATVVAMALIFLAGEVSHGSKRWINLGFYRFQPSEFGKVVFVLFLAGFLADRGKAVGEGRTVLKATGLALVPIALVVLQPDIGTALVYAAAFGAALFLAGTRWLHLGIVAAGALLAVLLALWILPAGGIHPLKAYQQDRLLAFLHHDRDPQGTTYNIQQSITAVGAGGVRGRGVSGATQTSLNYLPEHSTDFAFASLAEQRGFLGAGVLLLLYLLVVWRGLKIIAGARDSFAAIAAGGIIFAFLFQVFVNIGMTVGIAPITGIPLPFVSVGGSSLIANLAGIGVLLAIHARSRAGYRRGA
jgi:rod shape determining protein RodA